MSEVREWLAGAELEGHAQQLVEELGYDDLEALAQCSELEAQEMASYLSAPEAQKRLLVALSHLQGVGVSSYRKSAGLHVEALVGVRCEGYVSVCVSGDWADKWCVLEGGLLSWKRAKKASESEGKVSLLEYRARRRGLCVEVGPYKFELESEDQLQQWFPGLV
jgi:hypothetical protein